MKKNSSFHQIHFPSNSLVQQGSCTGSCWLTWMYPASKCRSTLDIWELAILLGLSGRVASAAHAHWLHRRMRKSWRLETWGWSQGICWPGVKSLIHSLFCSALIFDSLWAERLYPMMCQSHFSLVQTCEIYSNSPHISCESRQWKRQRYRPSKPHRLVLYWEAAQTCWHRGVEGTYTSFWELGATDVRTTSQQHNLLVGTIFQMKCWDQYQ